MPFYINVKSFLKKIRQNEQPKKEPFKKFKAEGSS